MHASSNLTLNPAAKAPKPSQKPASSNPASHSRPIEHTGEVEMAGEVLVPVEGGRARDYGGGVTFSVAVTSLMAGSCGLIFGYDVGVSGACALCWLRLHFL
jgi:hypothetical protein